MVSIYYGLQQLSLLLYQQHMLYSTPGAGQWLAAHQLLECAMDNNFYQTNINQVLGTQHEIQNIAQAYARLILLDILILIRFVLLKFRAYIYVVQTGRNWFRFYRKKPRYHVMWLMPAKIIHL